jgi:hypothetical protein
MNNLELSNIPTPTSTETNDAYIARCIATQDTSTAGGQALAYSVCKKAWTNKKFMKEEKEVFILKPRKSEKRGDYLSRCSAHPKMKAQTPNMKERMSGCLSSFNEYYKYWAKLEDFASEDAPEMVFEGCMSEQRASGKDYKQAYQYCMTNLIIEPVAMENMESNIEACAKRRVKEEGISHEQAKKECSASVVVSPAGGTNPSVAPQAMADYPWDDCISDQIKKGYTEDVAKKICGKIKAENQSAEFAGCPPSTQDIKLNLKNRQDAIDTAHYGPLDPNQPNDDYWKAKADQFHTSVDEAKGALCGNCGFFNQTKEVLDCIAKAIGEGSGQPDPYDTIQAGDVGYCEAFDFKCAGKRTCDAWLTGGPIK